MKGEGPKNEEGRGGGATKKEEDTAQPTREWETTQQGRVEGGPGKGTPLQPPKGREGGEKGERGNPTKMSANPESLISLILAGWAGTKSAKLNGGGVGGDKICKVESWRGGPGQNLQS